MGMHVGNVPGFQLRNGARTLPTWPQAEEMGSKQPYHDAQVCTNPLNTLTNPKPKPTQRAAAEPRKDCTRNTFYLSIIRKMDLIGTCEDGNYFYLNATSDSERLTHEVWGHVYHPNGNVYKINACNLDLEKLGENGPMPRHFSLRFSAKRHSYHAIICLMPQQFDSYTGRPWQHRATLYPCHVTLNCRQGRVLLTVTNTFHGDCPLQMNISVPYLASPKRAITTAERQKIVLSLDEESCSFEELVGAKAASLALLRSGLREAPVAYSVPDGFCLTAAAWRRQLNALPQVRLRFKSWQLCQCFTSLLCCQVKDTLERICRLAGAGSGDLEEACDEVCRMISQVSIDDHIVECVDEVLRELFQSGGLKRKFAVRSSAVGEDGRELSCAGMNATFLGCQGHAAVLKSVLDCWASLFSYQSVEYRRQHGMPLMPGEQQLTRNAIFDSFVVKETFSFFFFLRYRHGRRRARDGGR